MNLTGGNMMDSKTDLLIADWLLWSLPVLLFSGYILCGRG